MASQGRYSAHSLALKAALAERPYAFEFYQALRLLDAMNSDLPRIGEATRANLEAVRLGQAPSLAFPISMLASFEPAGEAGKDRLDVRFFGMFGPNGPLPLHLTEFAHERELQDHDPTLRRFLDLFHHRMLSLFYRAWANSQPCVSYDRGDQDHFAEFVGSLIGVGLDGARKYDSLPDHSRYYLAGLLGMQHRPATALEALVEEFLQVPTIVQEFVGEWLRLPADAQLKLGSSNNALGANSTIGASVWSRQGRFRIVCGALSMAQFRRLLPDSDSVQGFIALVRSFAGDAFAWELQLILRAEEVPCTVLGERGQLGWTTWLGNRSSPHDATDVLLEYARYQ